MKNTATLRPGTTSARRFRYIGRDFQATWVPAAAHDRRIVQANGDLVLELCDLWDLEAIRAIDDVDGLVPGCSFGEFLDEEVLERWADGWSFSLEGINTVEALMNLVYAFLLPAIKDLPNSSLHRAVQQARNGDRARNSLPQFTLQLDGGVVRYFLLDIFDGPFAADEDFMAAADKRCQA